MQLFASQTTVPPVSLNDFLNRLVSPEGRHALHAWERTCKGPSAPRDEFFARIQQRVTYLHQNVAQREAAMAGVLVDVLVEHHCVRDGLLQPETIAACVQMSDTTRRTLLDEAEHARTQRCPSPPASRKYGGVSTPTSAQLLARARGSG